MKLLILALSPFFFSPALAIINVEAVRSKKSDDGWSGQISLSGEEKTGNTVKSTVKLGSLAHYRFVNYENLVIANYSFGSSGNITDTNKKLIHLRHAHFIDQPVAAEVFLQYESDEFTRLSLRGLFGAGARIRVHHDEDLKFYLGSGAFYSKETLDKAAGLTDDGTSEFWRFNFYVSLVWQVGPLLDLNNTSYFQPVVDDFNDYRLSNTSSLNIKANDKLSVSLFYKLSSDSRPPQTIKDSDSHFGSELKYSF